MFLKRLELKGFKSFPEKITLEFNKGITAIVGPNGSGKSNVSDAIRWVLGEQSVKNLRGSNKMEDVIFAGTQNRSKLSFAEVAMVIDNSENKLNIDYPEVVVVRRLYRSGESEFLINGASCRLKDIHELFMDTGIGKEGYSIIGQGRIDEILSTKSEDRRLLFEKAVGIVKFKNRKLEAERKLEREKQNLIRVNDIISELEVQVEPLKLQAEKTRKYLSLAEKLKLVQVNLFVNDIKKIENDCLKADENLKIASLELEEKQKRQLMLEAEKENLKGRIEEFEKNIELKNNEITSLKIEKEQNENKIKLINQNIEHELENIERTKKEITNNEAELSLKKESILINEAKKKSFEMELIVKNESLNNLMSEFEVISSAVSKREENIEAFNTNLIEKLKVVSEIDGSIKSLIASNEQYEQRQERISEEYLYSENRINEKDVHKKVLEIRYDGLCKKEASFKDKISRLTKEKADIQAKIQEEEYEKAKLTKKLNEANSRNKILTELERDYEGYYTSVKSVLKQKEQGNSYFSGICGAVGELIKVDKKYETAIETALGGAVQNIVTKTERDAQNAIEYLKKNNKGRATFLPMTSVKPQNFERDIPVFREKGIIGTAKSLVSYNAEYENVISSILGKVLIADNLDNAVLINKKYAYSYKIVTLEGDVLNRGGSLTGGSINKKSAGIFSRGREIKELEEKITLLSSELQKNAERLSVSNDILTKLVEDDESVKSNINELILEKAELKNKIEQVQIYIKELEDKKRSLGEEKDDIFNKLEKTRMLIEEKHTKSKLLKNEIENIHKNISEFQTDIQFDREKKEQQNKQLINLRLEISELEFNISSCENELKRIESEIQSNNEKIKKNQESLLVYKNATEDYKKEIGVLEKEIASVNHKKENCISEYNSLIYGKDEVNNEIEITDKRQTECFEEISELKNEISKAEILKAQFEEKSRVLYDDMWDKYELTYVSAKEYEKLDLEYDKMKKEEKNLREEIKSMGSINPDAIEEYKSVKERYEFLTLQREDILNAEKDLNGIISELLTLMEKQFKEQFKIISENFGQVFSEIFGGGTGYLKLSEEKDVLNSGIEIVAQPPGKNLQSMSLLSGGERALTAIALLFAILKMKPSPFCILDEIEAALDDSNVKRYADYLKSFSKETQFIVITHRKGTMEAADTMYGVTMQEQGISKLVSVKFVNEN